MVLMGRLGKWTGLGYLEGMQPDERRRIARMIRRGRALQALVKAFPNKLTLWLLKRQVRRLEAAVGKPSPMEESWDRLYSKRSPHALIHHKRLQSEKREEEDREVAQELKELFESVRNWK